MNVLVHDTEDALGHRARNNCRFPGRGWKQPTQVLLVAHSTPPRGSDLHRGRHLGLFLGERAGLRCLGLPRRSRESNREWGGVRGAAEQCREGV